MAWIVSVGMPLALFLWFSIAYFTGIDVENPQVADFIVSSNIVLWSIVAFVEIKSVVSLEYSNSGSLLKLS